MPEGDTVFRTCARLHEALAGRVLVAAELRWPSLATADLTGMTVSGVVPRGKHILLRLDSGWTLHSHLKMEGQWRIEHTDSLTHDTVPEEGARNERPSRRAAATWLRHPDVRAALITQEWTAIGLRLGVLDLVRTSEEHTLVGHLGPDILAADFDVSTAVANLASSDTTIGAALLDQRNLAGIGTMWAAESLFLERVNPWAEHVDASVITRVVERARRLMTAATASGRQSSTGSSRPGDNTWVHGRSGRPCRRCGTTIRVAPIGPPTRERVLFSCPTCQGGLAPTDDGRPIAPLGARGGRRGRREPR
ncbi:MAG: DNA-formamidopyrimidine glycosylase family protein [Propionicimonas sp.]|uniref:Fpg/Nei family DNA glycosylase n=1 Tax=Propionicimonas sp. TaxID=1955623 RepID=UPI003D12BFA0